jgi:hypothetical protein
MRHGRERERERERERARERERKRIFIAMPDFSFLGTLEPYYLKYYSELR